MPDAPLEGAKSSTTASQLTTPEAAAHMPELPALSANIPLPSENSNSLANPDLSASTTALPRPTSADAGQAASEQKVDSEKLTASLTKNLTEVSQENMPALPKLAAEPRRRGSGS